MLNSNTSKATTVVPVLADEYLKPVELVDFYVANILDRRKTAEAIKFLSTLHPLRQFQHLKRVRSAAGKNCTLQILICPLHRVLEARSCNACKESSSNQTLRCEDGFHLNADQSSVKASVPAHRKTQLNEVTTLQNYQLGDNKTNHCSENTGFGSCSIHCSDVNRVLHQDKNIQSKSSVSKESSSEFCEEKDIFHLGMKDVTDYFLHPVHSITSLLGCQVEEGMFGQPYLIKVPKCAPLTRKQFEESLVFWPVNFHEDKRVAKLVCGEFFSESDVSQIQSYLKEAADMAKMASQKGQGSVGVVIVDPVTDTVICRGHSLTRDNMLMHAAMVAVDLVAKLQGGGMWNITDKDMYILPVEATQGVAAADTMPERTSKGKTGPYLCTGYHVYMTEEPCPMCTMALLHSRVARVIYSQTHPHGALGSTYKLHTHPSLNHHFDVFHYTRNIHSDS